MSNLELKCSVCKDYLFTDIEHDLELCDRCADRMTLQEQNRREWNYYHTDTSDDGAA